MYDWTDRSPAMVFDLHGQTVLEAVQNAADHGYKGAMFPWESAASGNEETPVWALSGPFEHHITADVGIAAGPGRGLLFSRGRQIGWVPADRMVDALLEEAVKVATAKAAGEDFEGIRDLTEVPEPI